MELVITYHDVVIKPWSSSSKHPGFQVRTESFSFREGKSPYRLENEQFPVLKTRNSNRKQLPASWVSPASSCFYFLEPVWWEVAGVKCLHHWSLTCFNWRSKPGKGEFCCFQPGFSGSASLNFRGVTVLSMRFPVIYTKIIVFVVFFFLPSGAGAKTLLMDSDWSENPVGFLATKIRAARATFPTWAALYLE